MNENLKRCLELCEENERKTKEIKTFCMLKC